MSLDTTTLLAILAMAVVTYVTRIAGLFVNRTTGNVTYVSVKGTDLLVGRTDGPVLTPLGPRRFWLDPQRTEWTFAPNGDVTVAFRGSPPRKPVTLVRREASRPSPTALAAYAGRYVSQELGVTYAVSAADTALRFRTGVTEPFTALPAYGDSFLGRAMVEFTRDSSNRITGLLMSTGRVRRIRFTRLP